MWLGALLTVNSTSFSCAHLSCLGRWTGSPGTCDSKHCIPWSGHQEARTGPWSRKEGWGRALMLPAALCGHQNGLDKGGDCPSVRTCGDSVRGSPRG